MRYGFVRLDSSAVDSSAVESSIRRRSYTSQKKIETVDLVRVLNKQQREARLSRRRLADRERARARRGSETATQREVRLARRRIADRSRRVSQSQSTEEREARLHQLRVTQQQRIATEEREARLQQVRVTQQQRIATESTEERGPSSAG